MIFKFEGQEMEVPDDFILKCGEHAEARGMTLEEYIAEAFTMYKKQLDDARKNKAELPPPPVLPQDLVDLIQKRYMIAYENFSK